MVHVNVSTGENLRSESSVSIAYWYYSKDIIRGVTTYGGGGLGNIVDFTKVFKYIMLGWTC